MWCERVRGGEATQLRGQFYIELGLSVFLALTEDSTPSDNCFPRDKNKNKIEIKKIRFEATIKTI